MRDGRLVLILVNNRRGGIRWNFTEECLSNFGRAKIFKIKKFSANFSGNVLGNLCNLNPDYFSLDLS